MSGKDNSGFELNEPPSNGTGGFQDVSLAPGDPVLSSMSKTRIRKNLLIVCIGFVLLFSAFQALGNLQSTINDKDGVGVYSLSTIYAAIILSSLFLPTIIIQKLGCKLALGLCMLTYTPYIAAHFDPKFYFMIPAAIILGMGASPMWSAKCTYLNEIGFRYSKYVGAPMDTIIVRFFGIFFMSFQNSQIWGNLISFLILKTSDKSKVSNSTDDVVCGINFDNKANSTNSNLEEPDDDTRYLLFGVFLGLGLLGGILVLLFLDPLEREMDSEKSRDQPYTYLFFSTFRHMMKKEQIILIPLTIFSGLEQAFFLSEFTRSYVGCAWGISNIGKVAICFGVVNAIVSLSSGPSIALVKRLPIFVTAALADVIACLIMIFWTPNKDENIVFFVVAGIWAIGDGVWQTQINGFYGVIFKGQEEPAFANYRLWESLGFVFAFAYANHIGVPAKMGILLSVLAIGMVGYIYIEVFMLGKKKKKNECS